MPDHQAKFVKPPAGAAPTALLHKAFTVLESREVEPIWLEQDQVLAVTDVEKYCIYVCDPFQGAAFEHLEKLKARVYGPSCVLSCYESQKPLPKSPQPLYSTAMRGLLVCFSNVKMEERDKLMKMVEMMGGDVLKVLTENVTHLVTCQVGSKKYIVAASMKIPIMLPAWIDAVWKASTVGRIHGANEDFKKFACPVFQGISVTVSGLDVNERKAAQAAVESSGGTYSGEMRMNQTTHLITSEPKGQKYNFARKWKIHIVHPQWLHDSLHNGSCADESQYSLDSCKTSTPTKSDKRLPSMNDVSSIMSSSMMSLTSVNETVNSTAMNATGLTTNTTNITIVDAKSTTDPLDELEIKSGCDLLDGCKVYLSGFCGERLDKIRKFVSMAGGTRFNQVNDDVTHVIVNGKMDSGLQDELKDCASPPHVVTVHWLISSSKAGKLLPEDEFTCSDKPPLICSPVIKRAKTQAKLAVNLDATTGQCSKADNDDMSDLLSQYMTNANDETTRDDGNDTTLGPDDVTRLEGDVTKSENEVVLRKTEDKTETNDETVDDGSVLSGRTVFIVGFDAEIESELKCIAEELGGKIVTSKSRNIPHYAVVPMFGCPVPITVDDVVTNFWLQQCHEEQRLIKLDENVLYKPLAITDKKPLESAVLAITGFVGMERDSLLHIAQTLGATVQEFFCKKTTKKATASTHLLAAVPEGLTGSKYEAAKKVNVPIVRKEWLLKCAETGIRQPEKDFEPRDPDETTIDPVDEHSPKPGVAMETSREAMPPPAAVIEKQKISTPSNKTSVKLSTPVNKPAPTPANEADSAIRRKSNHRVAELVQEEKRSTPIADGKSAKDVDKMTPRTALANISFDLSDAFDYLNTPGSANPTGKKHNRKSSLPIEDLYNYHINLAVARFENPDESHSPAPSESQNSEEDKPLKGVVIAVSKKLASKQSEYFNMAASLGADYRWVYDNSCTHYIFQGRSDSSKEYKMAKDKGKYIVSPYWLIMCEQQNSRVDEGLFPANFNPSMSLCVTTPRPTPVRRTRASSNNTQPTLDPTASPALPVRTRQKQSSPPPTLPDDDDDLANIPEPDVTAGTGKDENGNDAEKRVEKTEPAPVTTPDKPDSGAGECGSSLEMQQVIQRELEDIMANSRGQSSNSAPRRRSRKPDSVSNRSGARVGRSRSKLDSNTENTDHTELLSQPVEVTWDDPTGRREQEKYNHVLHKPYSPTQHTDYTQHTEPPKFSYPASDPFLVPAPSPRNPRDLSEEKPPPTPEPPSLTFPRPKPSIAAQSPQPVDPPSVTTDSAACIDPKFLLSGMSQEEKDNYGALIERLGGTLLDAPHFSLNCTHLITAQPTRNEKCLAGIASGKWILHKSYLEACKAAGMFVKEEEHEWGSAGTLAVKQPAPAIKLAHAAHRWRVKLQKRQNGAFHDWKVIICTPKQRTGGFKRLLEAGGAKVLAVRPPFTSFLSLTTHAFMDLPKVDFEVNLEEFIKAGVACYKPEYIAGFLMEEFLDPDNYTVPEISKYNAETGKKRKSSGSTTEMAKKTKLMN